MIRREGGLGVDMGDLRGSRICTFIAVEEGMGIVSRVRVTRPGQRGLRRGQRSAFGQTRKMKDAKHLLEQAAELSATISWDRPKP